MITINFIVSALTIEGNSLSNAFTQLLYREKRSDIICLFLMPHLPETHDAMGRNGSVTKLSQLTAKNTVVN